MKTDSALANDRTFLAWLRTGIALIGLGFVVAKISLIADPSGGVVSDKDLYTGVGVLIVLCGAAVVVIGYRQHTIVSKDQSANDHTGTETWPRSITAVALLGALLLSALIVVTT